MYLFIVDIQIYYFTCRPEIIVSDNGTNFVGATSEVIYLNVNNEKVQKILSVDKIKWMFNPPAAPHFGGIFEVMIKSVKKAMVRILKNADVNDEELGTTLIEVEQLINSRPIGRKSMDSKECEALTPNHFLVSDATMKIEFAGQKLNIHGRWKKIQELTRHI